MNDKLRARVAAALGWTMQDTKSFSVATLRSMVRDKDPDLAADIDDLMSRGDHLIDRGGDYDPRRIPMPDMSWLGDPPPNR